MTKFAVLFAAAVALASPDMAYAASPDGLHIFQGTVDVKKNLPVWSTCTMTVVINVSAGVPRLQSAALTGAAPCSGLTYTGLPSPPFNFLLYPVVTVHNVTMNWPPIGPSLADSCFGDLKFVWSSARTITFQNSLSDLPDGMSPPCKIIGILSQTSGSLNLP